jgi:hypothetical protein
MSASQETFALLAWALMALILAGLWRTGRGRTLKMWTLSLAVALVGNTVVQVLPSEARQFYPWISRQLIYVVLDLLVLCELTRRLTAGAPRSQALGRYVLALVALNLSIAALWRSSFPRDSDGHWIVILIRADVILAAGFLALGLLLLWHCRPVGDTEKAVLAGLPVLRLLHAPTLWLWLAPGLAIFGDLYPVAEVAVMVWWAWRAWAPPEWRALRPTAVTS